MSKQSEAKTNQNYRAKPQWPECRRCKWFAFDAKYTVWPSGNCKYETHTNLRCTLGGFKVGKLSTCDKWEVKE